MSRVKFAKYTEKIRSKLPNWLQMKKQPNDSLGLQFLNFFGVQFDDIKSILEYAYKQTRIEDADEAFVDTVYKAMLPTYFDMKTLSGVIGSATTLAKADTLYKFFGLAVNYELDEPIHQPNYYYVDEERKIVYVRESYDKDRDMQFGQIDLVLTDGSILNEALTLHHVWNFFDEFGALLSCPRLFGEKNHDYKNRILDVFLNPANSTKVGLANGISRELGIRYHKVWTDPSQDFIIKEKMVMANHIKVENDIVKLEDVYISTEGYLVLNSRAYETKKNLKVTYIAGIEIKALTDHSDNKFNNETYYADGMPTDLMLSYINNIKNNSSVLWGDFKYNEGMWVKDDEEFDDCFAFIPATYDSNIKGFEKFGFFNK